MCQLHYLRETERDSLFVIVMSSHMDDTMAATARGQTGRTGGLGFLLVFFFLAGRVMITNLNKAAGRGSSELFAMQIQCSP